MKINITDLALFLSEIELPEGVISISKDSLGSVPHVHMRESTFKELFQDIDYHRREHSDEYDALWTMIGNVEVATLEKIEEDD
jgi:hypothetical protein